MTTQLDYLPTLPLGYIHSLQDSGNWRDVGITHWHLLREEDCIIDQQKRKLNERRFDTYRIQQAVALTPRSTADPRTVLLWVYHRLINGILDSNDPIARAAQHGWHSEEDLLFSIRGSWMFLTDRLPSRNFTPIGSGIEIRRNWSLDVHAYPQTAQMCSRHAAKRKTP